jgi:hypothetical protein
MTIAPLKRYTIIINQKAEEVWEDLGVWKT